MRRIITAALLSLSWLCSIASAQVPFEPVYNGLILDGLNGGTLSGTAVTNYFASPPCIGCTVPNSGAFTTLSATSTVNGAGFTALFAAPPPIGLTTPNSIAATTLSGGSGGFVVSATGSISHNPTTAFALGVVPGITQFYAASGSVGTATSAAINAFDLTSDNLAVSGAPSSASLALLSAYDFNFGGSNATGGRLAGDFNITQTAAPSPSSAFNDYIALHGTMVSSSGAGGTTGSEKGNYYGLWSSNILQAGATHIKSMNGLEIDMSALTGSSVLYKTGMLVGGANQGTPDAVQGSVVDNLIWLSDCTTCVGSKVGIQFGRSDGFGGVGVSATGALIQVATETATVGTGVDVTGGGSLTITGNAWQSPGASITGSGILASSGTSTTGIQSTGTKSVTGFYEASTAPYGMQLIGTYSTASFYITTKPDFHYAGTAGVCTIAGKIPVLINGVAQFLAYC